MGQKRHCLAELDYLKYKVPPLLMQMTEQLQKWIAIKNELGEDEQEDATELEVSVEVRWSGHSGLLPKRYTDF